MKRVKATTERLFARALRNGNKLLAMYNPREVDLKREEILNIVSLTTVPAVMALSIAAENNLSDSDSINRFYDTLRMALSAAFMLGRGRPSHSQAEIDKLVDLTDKKLARLMYFNRRVDYDTDVVEYVVSAVKPPDKRMTCVDDDFYKDFIKGRPVHPQAAIHVMQCKACLYRAVAAAEKVLPKQDADVLLSVESFAASRA